jgi:hypothetical protein
VRELEKPRLQRRGEKKITIEDQEIAAALRAGILLTRVFTDSRTAHGGFTRTPIVLALCRISA